MTPFEVALLLGRSADKHGVLGSVSIHRNGRITMEAPDNYTGSVVRLAEIDLAGDGEPFWCISLRSTRGWDAWSECRTDEVSMDDWMSELRIIYEKVTDADREVREGSL